MYNRYIPQPDGSFRRDLIHTKDPQPQTKLPPKEYTQSQQHPCTETSPPIPPKKETRKHAKPPSPSGSESISSFFRNLLPSNLDTGDLLVIILLLLIAGDCKEDQNHALLTLLLYLFL